MKTFALTGYRALLGKELREAWRTSRLPVTVAIFFILGMLSPLAAHYTPELLKNATGNGIQIHVPPPTLKDAIVQYIKNVAGNGFLIAIVLAMGSIAREKERGTAAFLLTKPISRLAFVAAKFTALVATLGMGLLVATVTAYAYTVYFFGATSALAFAEMGLLVWLALTAFLTLTFLASALTSSTVAAASLGFAAWLVMALLGISPRLQPNTPNGLFDAAQSLALGATPQHLAQSLIATIVIIVAALALTQLIFARQELAATSA
ncbi:MAG TPA: ABC transporter permease subunit [Ktedonobacterales bacterium]|jgi:ABC-2 type transport system permease protein|nr:ABC transporter permease subunit [Ktedonobacterales bacterium]